MTGGQDDAAEQIDSSGDDTVEWSWSAERSRLRKAAKEWSNDLQPVREEGWLVFVDGRWQIVLGDPLHDPDSDLFSVRWLAGTSLKHSWCTYSDLRRYPIRHTKKVWFVLMPDGTAKLWERPEGDLAEYMEKYPECQLREVVLEWEVTL